MLVPVKQLRKESNQPADKVTEEVADKPLIKEITKGNVLSSSENLEARKKMIEAKGFEPTDFAYERAIGKNDSLYSNFTELIALTKRKVGRIVIIEDDKKLGFATGFMVSKDLLLTNWHVFPTEAMAAESEIQFFYEYDVLGHPLSPVIFKLDTKKFYQSNEDLDYCFVAVEAFDETGKTSLETINYLFLDKSLGKIGDVNVERLNIIHHPLGDYKQISIRENLFTGIDETKIFYETDTAQGSSGSPVFNDQWQVVGLHHKSVAKMTADGLNYLDKDNNIIPVTNNQVDASRIVWLNNEGMRISVVLKHLEETSAGNELVAAISRQPAVENLNFTVNNTNKIIQTNNDTLMPNDANNININVPVSALESGNTIEINISSKKATTAATTLVVDKSPGSNVIPDAILMEVAKADKEQAEDFSKCTGYNPNFLGVQVPLPQVNDKLQPQLARKRNKAPELKYFKYSVIYNAVRKMPVISAINVEGDADKRKDNSKRDDDWLRDKRIDIEAQLTDQFYAGSHFDKGHMSRFEDADWANTEEDALRNGIYTCFYTNACPQVVKLNRAGGLWGKLEKQVLEQGIKKQQGREAKMTVFNGPIFDETKDKIFKGVTIPMQFYKIILWLDDANKLKATAFKLSQETLVDVIKFDEIMRLTEEALDIDQVVAFKHYQVSIKSLSDATDIDFSHIESFDTFKAAGTDEVLLKDEESLML